MAQSWKAAAYRDTQNPGQAKCLRRGLPFPYVPPRRDGGPVPKPRRAPAAKARKRKPTKKRRG